MASTRTKVPSASVTAVRMVLPPSGWPCRPSARRAVPEAGRRWRLPVVAVFIFGTPFNVPGSLRVVYPAAGLSCPWRGRGQQFTCRQFLAAQKREQVSGDPVLVGGGPAP